MYTHTESRIILKFADAPDGTEKDWVTLDNYSGGYPAGTNNPLNAYSFSTIEKAEQYAASFNTYPLKLQPKAYILTVTAVVTPT